MSPEEPSKERDGKDQEYGCLLGRELSVDDLEPFPDSVMETIHGPTIRPQRLMKISRDLALGEKYLHYLILVRKAIKELQMSSMNKKKKIANK